MDPIPFIAMAIGLGSILGGNALEGGSIDSLVQPTAALIVAGGTLAATWLASTNGEIGALKRLLPRLFKKNHHDPAKVMETMVGLAADARKDGLLALESRIPALHEPFLQRGLRLLVDGTPPEQVVRLLELDIEVYEHEYGRAGKVLETAGGFAPTIGIIGAVLGLIHVMHNLSDPSSLGDGIAVAFVATVYGVGIANLFALPMGMRLKKIVAEEASNRQMILTGIQIIGAGENPRHLEAALTPYLEAHGVNRKAA
jgi:chemotaxis protein MotA